MLKQAHFNKLPRSARPIGVKHLMPEEIHVKYRTRCYRGQRAEIRDTEGKVILPAVTEGKTARDHRTGAWNQRFTRVGSHLKPRQQHRGDVAD